MTAWRLALFVALAGLVGLPLAQPFLGITRPEVWSWQRDDLSRVARLAANTLLLAGGTVALALPPAVLLALLLFRGDLPGRSVFRVLLVVSLFVPLPVLVSCWQGTFGSDGLLPWTLWGPNEVRPWTTGWGPAIWIHALAGLPWAVLIVGLGLRWVEPELEEEARLSLPPWLVVLSVTLPRCRASIMAAGLFLALSAAGEISVTDMMLIPTFAEEVHTQFVLGEYDALTRTLVLSLPWLLLVGGVLLVAVGRFERELPPLPFLLQTQRPFPVRRVWLPVLGLLVGLLVSPVGSLVWKLGLAGQPRGWSAAHAWNQLVGEAVLFGGVVARTFLVALATGALIAGLALVCCWLAEGSRPLRAFLLVVLALAWVLPGPVVGIGLKDLILDLVQILPDGPWARLLYYGPSPLPIVWVQVIRFLPAAVFFLWPVVRLVPVELREAARLEGAGPLRELAYVVWPMTRPAVGVAALALSALCLGEVAASTRVETPGWESFTRLLFDRMHYGVDSNVAALALLLLAFVAALAGAWFGGRLAACLWRARA